MLTCTRLGVARWYTMGLRHEVIETYSDYVQGFIKIVAALHPPGPIIGHVLRTKQGSDDRLIRAIILHAMKVPANSHLEALNRFLAGGCVNDAIDQDGIFHPASVTPDVTFGRYTGQDERNCRTEQLILVKYDELARHAQARNTYASPDPPPSLPDKLRPTRDPGAANA